MKITIVAGARPNFMKIAPIIHSISKKKKEGFTIDYRLVHTGQHYDKSMSGDFFEQLGIPEPHANLASGGGSQAEQTGAVMVRFEKDLAEHPSDLVLVVGDVTSTMACAIVAQKMHTPVAHVEAGIRSGDWTMPEEINRLVTDSITNYFFTTSEKAGHNLVNAGVPSERIFFVGNTMIDTLLKHQEDLRQPSFWPELGLRERTYFVVTLHRPANVDNAGNLSELLRTIIQVSEGLPVVFPVHPRTAKILESLDITAPNLFPVSPMTYLEFNYLVKYALAVITDSGGITEETTVMGVPCMTLRDNTERPETIEIGTNELLGTSPEAIPPAFDKLFSGKWKKGGTPPLWDGKSAERIVDHLLSLEIR